MPRSAAGTKALALGPLPRLAQFGLLPPSLVPQLLPVTASDDKRCVRLAYYLLQVQLGAGAAGTPTLPPTRGGSLPTRCQLTPSPQSLSAQKRGFRSTVCTKDKGCVLAEHGSPDRALRAVSFPPSAAMHRPG